MRYCKYSVASGRSRETDMKNKRLFAGVLAVLSVIGAGAYADPKPIAEGAKFYIIWPQDGQVIPGGKFWLRMGLSGLGVAPAGIEKANTGHHHVLVDLDAPTGAKLDEPLPADAHLRHFGGGQTETVLD